MTSINIPEGVTAIGGSVFFGCSSLTSINIPQEVTSIGASAFMGCSSLTSINISEGVTSIGASAFWGCSNLTNINIPEGVTSIDGGTFEECGNLTNINIPEGVTFIGDWAFSGCSSLTSINIPKGVTSINHAAFKGCSSLTNINIPEGVTSVGDYAFWGCSSLTSVNISESVKSIGASAFSGCSSLTSINIPEGVTSVGASAFWGCSSLLSVNIPEGVTSVGDYIFMECGSLRSIRYSGTKNEWDALKVNIYGGTPTVYYNYDPNHKHLYQLKILNPSTCMTKGAGEQVCSLCGDFYEEEIKATGHKEVKDAAVAATCEKAGKSEGSHCSVCNKVIKAQKEVPALGHNWNSGKITKAATCTETGIKTYTCTRCQKTKTEEIKATGHKEVKDAAVAATCEKAGKSEGSHCSVCNKVIKAQKEVPALGHNWNSGKITKAATCTETGVKTYTCIRCKKTKTEEIKATGHKEVKDAAVAATCEKAGKSEGSHCSVCNKVIKAQKEVPALGHSWNSGKITKAATCTEAGVKTYTCTRCQKTKTEEIKATGHKEVKDAAVAATCEKAGKSEGSHCSVCNKVIKAQKEVPALGHSWDAGKVTKAATCTETGVKTYTCTRCKKTKTEEIKATGHKFSAWKTSSKATIYSPAKQTRECTSCYKKQTRDIGKKLKATIKVSASKITMQPQQRLGTLKVTFANGDSVKSWKSSNPNIFKVVGKTNGKCTLTAGRIAGTAKLTIKLKSGLTKDVSITVKSVKTTKILGVKSAITLKVKKTTTLKPVLAPKNSTEKITYKSSDSKIVTVNAAGKVVAKKKGTAYIYVKSGSKTATCKIVVK